MRRYFWNNIKLRKIDYRDFTSFLFTSTLIVSPLSVPSYLTAMTLISPFLLVLTSQEIISRWNFAGCVMNPCNSADSPIIPESIKVWPNYERLIERERKRNIDENCRWECNVVQYHLHAGSNRRPGRCVTTPLLRAPRHHAFLSPGASARIRFWIASRLGCMEQIALPRRIFR